MTYWDGSRWTPEPSPRASTRPSPLRRLFGAGAEAGLITLLIFGLIAGTTLAARGGNGRGPANKEPAGSCQVEGNVVHGWNLPIWELMNFMVTDGSGTSGWVIGFTDTGERWIDIPEPTGPTRYEFSGRTYAVDGTKYEVYATCTTG